MKKKTLLYISFFALINLACSSDDSINDSEIGEDEPTLTNYIYKTYNVTNIPNTVRDSTNYLIENNKIISASGVNLATLSENNSIYNYLNNRISQIQSFRDGNLYLVQSFNYESNGVLGEYITESFNIESQTSHYLKNTFTHTSDTIYSKVTESFDGINYGEVFFDYKIVLDQNDNRTYLERYDHDNNYTHYFINTYDANSNIINESKYWKLENENDLFEFENIYTTDNFENNYNKIWEATLTRKNLMLLYHLQSFALNDINAKSISKNNLNTYESTWGNSFAEFDIINLIDSNNNTISSDFKTSIESETFSRFTIEYIFE